MTAEKRCARCFTRRESQWFTHTFPDGSELHWDVDEANRLVQERVIRVFRGEDVPLDYAVLPVDMARDLIDKGVVDRLHVEHVPDGVWGLSVEVEYGGRRAHIIIDGNHRAVRAALAGVELPLIVLTPAEDAACRLPQEEIDRRYRLADELASQLLWRLVR
jgi:hypothetical protein